MKNKYIGISKVVILCDKKKGMAIIKSDVIESNIDDIIKTKEK